MDYIKTQNQENMVWKEAIERKSYKEFGSEVYAYDDNELESKAKMQTFMGGKEISHFGFDDTIVDKGKLLKASLQSTSSLGSIFREEKPNVNLIEVPEALLEQLVKQMTK